MSTIQSFHLAIAKQRPLARSGCMLVLVFISFLEVTVVLGREQEALAEVRKRIEERVSKFQTVDVTWKVTTHFTKEHGARLRATPFSNKKSEPGGVFPAAFHWQARLWCDGSKLRLEHARPSWQFDLSRFELPKEVVVFNGDTGRSLKTHHNNTFPNQGRITNDAMHVRGDFDFSPIAWHFRAFTYDGMLGAPLFAPTTEVLTESLGDKRCIVLKQHLRTSSNDALEHIMWFDPTSDYALLRYSSLWNGRLRYDHRIAYVRDDDGYVVPSAWTFEELDTNGKLLVSKSVDTFSIVINQPIPADIFRLEFPEGTSVSDQRKQLGQYMLIGPQQREYPITIRQLAAAETPAQVIATLKADEGRHMATGLVVVAAVLFGAVFVVAMFIVRLRKQRTRSS